MAQETAKLDVASDVDVDAMGAAVTAINSIPTYQRRVAAWNWLIARVESDLRALWLSEHTHDFNRWNVRTKQWDCACGLSCEDEDVERGPR